MTGTNQIVVFHCGIHLIAKPISHSISRLFNNMFEIGPFPDIWKLTHITAVFKRSGQKSSKTNDRQISILPTLSKIFESVIHNRLLNQCIDNNNISERQAAYC